MKEYVDFDYTYFKRLADNGVSKSAADTFKHIYEINLWQAESVSGSGSDQVQTSRIQDILPKLITELNIKILLDLPCGDFNWMKILNLDLSKYIGADIVDSLIETNNQKFSGPAREFVVLNIIDDHLPEADLILCRDCLVHFSFANIFKTISNLKKSRIKYLLTTSFPEHPDNYDIVTGDWRPLNLCSDPFNFPPPVMLINEHCTENEGRYSDKSLALWLIKDIPVY